MSNKSVIWCSDDVIWCSDDDDVEVLFDSADNKFPFAISTPSGVFWLTGDEACELAEALSRPMKVVDDPQADRNYNEAALTNAAALRLAVRFNYAKPGQAAENREVEVHTFTTNVVHPYFVGYDADRDDIRAFRLDRVQGRVNIF